jgi:alkanesulfonate monooxygenase SsuD/methylene tetrahydromethanopterin reductase-like flavin-dependent oxidoreductase (luciferase family)
MPAEMQPPVENMDEIWTAHEKALVESRVGGSIIGGAATVGIGLEKIINQTQSDELMINAMIFDHQARLRSYEIVADIWQSKTSVQTI